MHLEVLDAQRRKVFSRLPEFPGYYLAGGTALALQIGHRVSVDFDFLAPRTIPQQQLRRVENVFTGHTITTAVNNREELTVLIDGTKLTFLYYPFPRLSRLVSCAGVPLLNVKEIAVTKAYTIGRRGLLKDYVDLSAVLSGRHATLGEIIRLAERKYGTAFNARLFLEQLLYLRDVPRTPLVMLKGGTPTKGALLTQFKHQVQRLKL